MIEAEVEKNHLKKIFRRLSVSLRLSGMGEPMPKLVLYDAGTRRGLLRCGHGQVNALKSEILKVTEPVIKVLGVSGTMNSGKRKFLSTPNKD